MVGRVRSGVNDFIAKCVTEGINDRAIIPSFDVFYARAIPVGKERASDLLSTRAPARTTRTEVHDSNGRDRYNVTDSQKSLAD